MISSVATIQINPTSRRYPNLQRSAESSPLGDVASLTAITNAMWLVEEVFPVTGRRLCVLVDRNQDRLDVVIAPPFPF